MLSADFVREFRSSWLPNISDAGLARVLELLEKGSPLLVSGLFAGAVPTGCLATHIAWHHPAVRHRTEDAGVFWLSKVAGLNPATSLVILEWDGHSPQDWGFRCELIALLLEEREARSMRPSPARREPVMA